MDAEKVKELIARWREAHPECIFKSAVNEEQVRDWCEGKTKCPHVGTATGLAKDCLLCLNALLRAEPPMVAACPACDAGFCSMHGPEQRMRGLKRPTTPTDAPVEERHRRFADVLDDSNVEHWPQLLANFERNFEQQAKLEGAKFAERILMTAEVGCMVLHERGRCRACDAWRMVRERIAALQPASEKEGTK